MKKARNVFIKNLHYLCLIGVIALGVMTIIGSSGGYGEGDDTTTGDTTTEPVYYTDNGDGTVGDNVTGLMWQQEDDNTWRTWDEACNYCDALALGDYSDWRLPIVMELMSIVDYGTYDPSIDTTYFFGTNASRYWSSTISARNASSAWHVMFDEGTVDYNNKSDNYYVRCVRGEEYLTASDLTDNGDWTVTDNNTGFMWHQGRAGFMNWEEDPITYCEDLSLAGYTDWRLPNVKELRSIVDDSSSYGPTVDTNYFPDAHASSYWSSTSFAYNTSWGAWRVNFAYGSVDPLGKSADMYVRCVRGGQ